jgi:hypothetical protein
MENNTLVLVEVINGQSPSSRLITHETKPIDVTIGSRTSKVVFNVIPFSKNLSSLNGFGLFYIIHKWINML